MKDEKTLDDAFFRSSARSSYGRNASLGVIRAEPSRDSMENNKDIPSDASTDSNISNNIHNNKKASSKASNGIKSKITGQYLVDTRTLPKLSSATLTVKHPGMNSFENSLSMSQRLM